jgi:CelD/BcsL family acetyltransferase involved in cellulose biosynthesis
MTPAGPLAVRAQTGAADRQHITTRCVETLPALERELGEWLLGSWKALVLADPLASLFQSPGWCMPWYRSYHDEFDPFVVLVTDGSALVGVVPLAVRRATNEIGFASGTMADYRDIVAAPGYRRTVVNALLSAYRTGRFANPLQIGWIDPASDTPALVASVCRETGVHFVSWQQPCYRWTPVEGENLNKKFSRLRTHLNHFKRIGTVSFDVVSGPERWSAFRDAFFEQHSLRQLQADRPIAFDDPRRRRFYDRLFDSGLVQAHVTEMRLDDDLLSGHIGFVWRDVLMLGAPSISIEHEARSPALILLSWIMQNAPALGLKGFDLTIGDTEFKRRLGNRCVKVTAIEVFGDRGSYYMRAAKREATAIAKGLAAAALGRDAWKTRVLPAVQQLSEHTTAARRHGVIAAVRQALPADQVRTRSQSIRELTPDSVSALDRPSDDGAWQFHENRVSDLLLWNGRDTHTARAIRRCARSYARQRSAGATFHSLCAGGRLAAWCFCSPADDDGVMTIRCLEATGDFLACGADRVLLAAVARAAFAAGATRVLIREE